MYTYATSAQAKNHTNVDLKNFIGRIKTCNYMQTYTKCEEGEQTAADIRRSAAREPPKRGPLEVAFGATI